MSVESRLISLESAREVAHSVYIFYREVCFCCHIPRGKKIGKLQKLALIRRL